MKYRSDIDGLRTIAVFTVILNHAGFSFFSGGFVGVDVFFVISGFLITSIIYPKIVDNTFNLGWFFSRRIKRLMPVLFVVIGVTAAVFTFVMLPQDLMKFYHSIIWVLLYAANFFMWIHHGGYFGGNSQEVPLLHMWSLAVEEQYYFVWPIMLILSIKLFGPRLTAWFSAALFVALTVFSQWGTEVTIGAAYYLLPTRFFELLLGSCLAIFWHKLPSLNQVSKHGLSLIGLALIIGSSILLNDHSPFPGYNALYPIIGTALIIYAQGGVVNKLLSTKPMVYTGNISYSLYLWHWPIFCLMRYMSIELTLGVQIACIGLTYILSVASYHYVEQPFRQASYNSFKPVFLKLYALPTVCIALFAFAGIYKSGFETRFTPEIVAMEKSLNTFSSESRARCHAAFRDHERQPDDNCVFGEKSEDKGGVFIFGDSHANHLVPFVMELAEDANTWGQDYTLDRCLPLYGLNWGGNLYKSQRCKARNDVAIEHIQQNNFKYVVMAASWPSVETRRMYSESGRIESRDEKARVFEEQLLETVAIIVDSGAIPVLVEDTPTLMGKSPKCPIKQQVFNDALDCNITLTPNPFITDMFELAKNKHPEIVIVKPSELFCQGVECAMMLDSTPLYRDDDHLNEDGSTALATKYLKEQGNFIR